MLRFVLPIAFASCVVAYFGLPYIERLLAEWFRSDVELRAQLVMHSMEDRITELVEEGNQARLRNYVAKMAADERLLAILVCRDDGSTIYKTEGAPGAVTCEAGSNAKTGATRILQLPSGSVQVSRFDFDAAQPTPFRVLMLHDLSFVDRRQRTARDFVLVFVGISILLLALLVVLVAWLQLRRWVKVLIGDIRGKRFLDDAESPRSSLPILSQVRQVLAEAEQKQRLEIDFHENWTPQALRQVVRDYLHSSQVIIVSNREPYIHNFDADHHPVVQVPASGMVTALEPIMRACSGTWVAHGAGTADRYATWPMCGRRFAPAIGAPTRK
jgi:trehalose 6-phosphate synthase